MLLALAASLAFAETPPQSSSKEVLAQMAVYLNGDGVKDRAVLLHDHNGDDVDLAIYLSANGQLPSEPSLYKPTLGWTGGMGGTEPEVSVNHSGSLVLVFQNESIGRYRWRQQLTIAFRSGALLVAGYSYEDRDTLDLRQGGSCDLNFLSGRGIRNGKAIQISAAPVSLSAWTAKSVPSGC